MRPMKLTYRVELHRDTHDAMGSELVDVIVEPFFNTRDAARSMLNRHDLLLGDLEDIRENKEQGILSGILDSEKGSFRIVVCVTDRKFVPKKPTLQQRVM